MRKDNHRHACDKFSDVDNKQRSHVAASPTICTKITKCSIKRKQKVLYDKIYAITIPQNEGEQTVNRLRKKEAITKPELGGKPTKLCRQCGSKVKRIYVWASETVYASNKLMRFSDNCF